MIRILQVLPRLRRGGSQAMIMNLYRALDREKYQFDFIIFTPDHDDYYEEILGLGGKVYHFTKFNGRNLFKVKTEWKRFFQDHPEYRVLHSHVRSFASLYIPIAKKYGLKTIIHSHSTSNEHNVKGMVKAVLEYPLRYQADYLFSCSTEAGKWLFGSRAIRKENYFFIPNAIDLQKFVFDKDNRMKIRESLQVQDELLVGHVGGFETPKNHDFMIRCFVEFLSMCPKAKLLLVGDGTFEERIREMVKKEGISEQVLFAGLQSEVAPFLSAMDVFLFPSLWEGLPVSVVEAQASGLRCLLSDTITHDVEMSDLLTYYSLNESVSGWARMLFGIANKGRKGASELTLERLRVFDCSQVVKNLEQFYDSCINGEKEGV